MYLTQEIWLSNWNNEQKIISQKVKEILKTPFEPQSIELEVGYWRKANAIHNWFVNVVQKGEDDCGSYTVSFEQLVELKDLCEVVLKARDDKEKFEEVKKQLATTEGFFFGNTEYDDWYFEQLKNTIEIVEKIMKQETINKLQGKPQGWYKYHSSW